MPKFINKSIIRPKDGGIIQKYGLVMRITIFLICIGVIQAAAGAYSQPSDFSIDARNKQVRGDITQGLVHWLRKLRCRHDCAQRVSLRRYPVEREPLCYLTDVC